MKRKRIRKTRSPKYYYWVHNNIFCMKRNFEKATKNGEQNIQHSPHVYTVFRYIRESGRHGLPNVVVSADMVQRLRPWHNCITVSVANDTKQAVWTDGQRVHEKRKREKNTLANHRELPRKIKNNGLFEEKNGKQQLPEGYKHVYCIIQQMWSNRSTTDFSFNSKQNRCHFGLHTRSHSIIIIVQNELYTLYFTIQNANCATVYVFKAPCRGSASCGSFSSLLFCLFDFVYSFFPRIAAVLKSTFFLFGYNIKKSHTNY